MHVLVLMAGDMDVIADEVQREHEQFIDGLDRTNTVVLGGGWKQRVGSFDAAYLINCRSLDDAREIAASDPFVRAGAVRFEVVEWELVAVNPDAVDRDALLYP